MTVQPKMGRIALALSGAVVLLPVPGAVAQEGSGVLEPIVVLGRSLPEPAGAVAYGSVSVARERLTSEASGRLEGVLRDVAGFQQFRRTDSRAANPTSQGAALRSLGGNATSRALVTLDGVPLADPFAGFVPWAALDPMRLSSVRITRGGGGGAFGSGALAGTIALESASLDELPALSGAAGRGSRDGVLVQGEAARGLGEGFATLSGRFERGDGYRLVPDDQAGPVDVPARYRQWSVAGRAVAPLGEGTQVQARLLLFGDRRQRGQVDADAGLTGADASVRLVSSGPLPWEALAYVQDRGFDTRIVAVAPGRQSAVPALDQYSTPATGWGGKLELRPTLGPIDLQVGADVRGASGRTNERFRFQAGRFTRTRTAGGSATVAGGYIEASWPVHPGVVLTAGARLDRWSLGQGDLIERDADTGAATLDQTFPGRDGVEPTGRIGARWTVTPGLQARLAGYATTRLPTLNELYRPFRVGPDATAANAALTPERLRGGEVGLDLTPLPGAALGATLFWNEVADAIANVTRARGPGTFPGVGFVAGVYRVRSNVDAIRVRGLELTGRWQAGDVGVQGSYVLSDARVQAPGLELDGQRPAQTPRHQASLTVDLRPSSGFAAGWLASLTGRTVSSQFEDDVGARPLAAAWTLDGLVDVPLAYGLRARLSAENLFDATVEAARASDGTLERGTPRTVWLSLRYTLPR